METHSDMGTCLIIYCRPSWFPDGALSRMDVGYYYLLCDVLKSIVVIICSGVYIKTLRLLCVLRFHKEHCGNHLLLKTECVGKVHIHTNADTCVVSFVCM